MKKKITQLRWLAATLMFVAAMVMPSTAWAETITPTKPSNGDGSGNNPYQIGSAAELYWFAALVNGDTNVDGVAAADKAACAELTQNITVNSGVLQSDGSLADDASGFTVWTPISTDDENPYTGTFDGKGYTIRGLYFNDTNKYYIGLFGWVGSGSKICNVGIVDSYFNGWSGIGGVCGYCISGEITNCYNTGTVIGTGSNIGGVCGYSSGSITDCYNTGNVSGTSTSDQEGFVGGICGLNSGYPNMSTITRSYNSGKVSGVYYVGGVCGVNGFDYPAQTINCYNTGEVTGTYDVGGICGFNDENIEKCYNSAAVSGGSYVGSVCGFNRSVITICYYLSGTAAGGINGADVAGSAEVKTTDEFKSGEVCYLLNEGKTDGSQAWYQNLSAESGDAYPVFTSTGGNTVYGGYQHGETTIHYSNSASDYPHAHAYDSNATDEASGNHDKSYQGFYTWTDNVDKTGATVTATFTCAVCGKVETPGMAAIYDDEQTNTPATCTENGYNYYKTSYAFAGATFTDNYTQTVPALGHNMTAITFNNVEKIYSNHCQREGCGYIGHYATSDGMVEATYEDEVYKVASYTLQDATKYDNQAVFTATNFTYTRTFSNTNWTTWYVPFDLTLTQEICAKYDFSRINNVHQYDTDNDGTADKTVVESFRQIEGVTLQANYPYLVRAKSDADYEMSLTLTTVVPALAEANSIDCQSVDFLYTFTGTYTVMDEGGSSYYDPYTLWTDGTWQHFRSLDPMRHYLTVTQRNSSYASAASLRSIMLSVIGDEGTTGIVNMYSDERKAAETYDLGGRRLPAGASQKGVMIENGKVIYKK